MKTFNQFLLLIVLSSFLLSGQAFGSSGGRTGRTLKTATTGCGGCHGGSATPGVLVSITGPDTVTLNQSTTFTLTITGGPALGSGCDIASKYGVLSPVSSTLRLSGGELTQNANTPMTSGSVSYTFNYVYTGAQAIDSLYATGLSTNSNGGTSGDQWNWAPGKRIVIYTPPTPPSAPVLLSPANGVINQSVSLQLVWHSVSGAATYHAQLAADSLFTTMIHEDSLLVDTLAAVSSLQNNASYYWRVNAKSTGGTSGWSGVWKFTTIASPPPVPALFSPANGSTDQPVSLQLVWNSVQGALTYHAQLATDSQFAALVIDDSTLVDTLRPASSLLNNTSYYWRVSAKNAGGTGAWSGTWMFTTIVSPPSVPVLLSPANGATDQPVSLQLVWNSVQGALTYHAQMATDSLFTGMVVDDSTLVDTLTPASSLLNNTSYYWRVKATNAGGAGAWSGVGHFATIVALPDPVGLLGPGNDAPVIADTVLFSWNRTSQNDMGYQFELALDSSFAVSQVDTSIADTMIVIRNLGNQTYWWRVRARNAAGWGSYSEARRFTITLTGVGDDLLAPRAFKLDQNYPNPFNPTTMIRYDIPKASFVTLVVFNILGQEMASLVSGRKEAGSYEVQFDASNLTSGVYFYQMKAGSYTETRRLMLVR
jgi:hypothetical protein